MSELERYIEEMEANGLARNTIVSQESILKRLEKYKPLGSITEDELKAYFKLLKTEMTENSFALHQIVVKKFFRKIGKPELVDWIKKIKPKETLNSDDILNTDDINKLLEATDSHYYKAFISFLFESGARFSEIHALRYKDFVETDQGMVVNIPTTKTSAGFRKALLPFSSQYIRNLKVYLNAKPDDIVFSISNWQSNNMLWQIAEKSGITKPVNCHMFRHAQATAMVQLGYNEAIIRKKHGWSPTSTMIARYQHLNNEDVINATLVNTGKIPKTAIRTELKEAEKLTLVDAAQQFSKISDENEELKEKVKILEDMMGKLLADIGTISFGQEFMKNVKKK
jgi:integrase/recombinase XerD